MGQERGDRGVPPSAPPPLPPTPAIAPLYARCDAALADLDAWGSSKGKPFDTSRGPAWQLHPLPGAETAGGREGREPPGQVGISGGPPGRGGEITEHGG